ncbi:MAG: hypothetical protein HeimC3_30670 [Candidatus Heimdallarchaeota archaeon LC_3]|nr:MAG: hypothetical protein HeimC3_30670 [Candidatus Heimdallarchaeota archaeon LC_3]
MNELEYNSLSVIISIIASLILIFVTIRIENRSKREENRQLEREKKIEEEIAKMKTRQLELQEEAKKTEHEAKRIISLGENLAEDTKKIYFEEREKNKNYWRNEYESLKMNIETSMKRNLDALNSKFSILLEKIDKKIDAIDETNKK